jgi:hypothetical protein
VSRFLRSAAHLSGCGVGVTGGVAGLSHRNLTPHPSVRLLNRPAWTVITGLRLLKEMQNVLRAIGCPYRKKVMIGVL